MNDKLYINEISWKQNYPELIEYMRPFVEEYERIQLEESKYTEAKELIERIKNGYTS